MIPLGGRRARSPCVALTQCGEATCCRQLTPMDSEVLQWGRLGEAASTVLSLSRIDLHTFPLPLLHRFALFISAGTRQKDMDEIKKNRLQIN